MKWIKQGVIFRPDHHFPWMRSHAAIPVVDSIGDERIRIYFSSRDSSGLSRPTYIDVDKSNPSMILHVNDRPLLSLGQVGTFDDSGIMPSWILDDGGVKYLYYIAWNPQVTVPYRLSIGLAVSIDGGNTYRKYSEGPICDRDVSEPYFNTAPCVLKEGDRWRMWYVSCTGWRLINDRQEPLYHIKYAESRDGISWNRTGHICIDYDEVAEAIGRPCVYFQKSKYRMLYSFRSVTNYRSDPQKAYRLGYAESIDGIRWTRFDEQVGIERSLNGWDSEMIEYCYRFQQEDVTYLFYNGNGFGMSGVGYALLDTNSPE